MTEVQAPLDLHDFRQRGHRIAVARAQARNSYERYGSEEAEAEHEYRKRKAIQLAHYRNDGKSVGESEILAEGDVAEWRRKRDMAHVLAKSALLQVDELERNAASLRSELQASEKTA